MPGMMNEANPCELSPIELAWVLTGSPETTVARPPPMVATRFAVMVCASCICTLVSDSSIWR